MPMGTLVQRTTDNVRVIPLYPGDAKRININIPGGATFVAGTVMGQITSSANAVQTITDTPTITAGTFTLSGVHPLSGAAFTTAAIAYDATAAAVATAVATAMAAVGPSVTVTGGGGPLPGTDTTLTFSGNAAGRPVATLTVDNAGLTGGTLAVAATTAGRSAGTFVAYADAGTDDGRRVARGILEYTVTARSNGLVYVGQDIYGTEEGLSAVPMYITGTFRTTDLTGLDAAGVADLGRLASGTAADGILVIGG